MSKVVLCEYYIQNHDEKVKNKKRIMNAYVLPKAYNSIREVKVEDIKKYFPYDASKYHFRFQTRMGSMKVWVDTSKDSVSVPNIDEKIKIKLLELPKGVKPKKIKPSVQINAKTNNDVKKPVVNDTHNDSNLLNPMAKKKSMPHSNSQNNVNINSGDIQMSHSQSHKPMSQDGFEDELIGNQGQDYRNDNDYMNGMDFNLDTDDILGDTNNHPPSTQSHNATDGSMYEFGSNLLGDFDTMNNQAPSEPPVVGMCES